MSTQCNTSNIPVPSPEAWEPSLENSQLRRFELANWAQLVWLPLIMAAMGEILPIENHNRISKGLMDFLLYAFFQSFKYIFA